MKSKTFCILPWLHTHIEPDGKIFPCCLATQGKEYGNLQTDQLDTILNNNNYKKLRKKMLAGSTIDICSQCYKLETCGSQSLRQTSNENFQDKIESLIDQTEPDGTIKNPIFTSLDLRFSNACNFKCRTCNPQASTTWYEDHNFLTSSRKYTTILRPAKTKEEFWKMLEPLLPTLENIYIAGGEPLLESDHYLMLEKLIALKNTKLTLIYSTNFSVTGLGNKDIFDYWKQFEDVTVLLSYDGFGEKGEYIRKGMNWEKTLENHKKLQAHNKIKYIITPTISVFNAFHMPDLIEYFINEKIITDGNQLGLNMLREPACYNINIFTQDEKTSLISSYQNFIENKLLTSHLINKEQIALQLHATINFLKDQNKNIKYQRKQFLTKTVLLDKKRQEKLLSLFPELIGFYQ